MRIISLLMILFLLIGCEFFGASGDGDGGNDNSGDSNYSIIGNVQKGPFIIGSNVTIQVLNPSLIPTGQTFSTQTTDNFGSFSLALELNSRYVEIMVSGYYYDEVNGALSDSTLTLRSVSDLEQGKTININILTALQAQRLTKLVQDGSTFKAAQEQSLTELLDVFNIPSDGVSNFDKMDITGDSISDGILLAVSSVMQQGSTVAELSSELSTITTDIASDGVLDNSSVKDSILTSSYNLHMQEVETNLKNRYEELGQAYTIPESFRDFIDTDGDGVINIEDTEEYKEIAFDYACARPDRVELEAAIGENCYHVTLEELAVYDYVCARTEQIKNGLVELVGKSCEDITSENLGAYTVQLMLGNKGITSIKGGDFDGLSSLMELHLTNNQISTIEAGAFDELSNLRILGLSGSQITTIEPGAFNGLSNLEWLFLSQNQISTIEAGAFDGLSSLEELTLQNNQISTLSEGAFNGLNSLLELNLNVNDIQASAIPVGAFDGLSSLIRLHLQSNKLPPAEVDRITDEINALGGVTLNVGNQTPD